MGYKASGGGVDERASEEGKSHVMATNDRISIPPSLSRLAAIDSIFAGESLSLVAATRERRREERGGMYHRQAGRQAGGQSIGVRPLQFRRIGPVNFTLKHT